MPESSPIAPTPTEMDTLKEQVAALALLVQGIIPAQATPAPAVPAFVPPIAPSPTVAGMSPSIHSLFPDVEVACITSIINHEFRAADLYKLDSHYRDKETSYLFNGSTHEFEPSNRSAKDYKSLNSIILPLHVYFSILAVHIPNQRTIPLVFFQYLSHLQKIALEYDWAAVLEYHMVFFNRRRMEMLESGDYSRWVVSDTALM